MFRHNCLLRHFLKHGQIFYDFQTNSNDIVVSGGLWGEVLGSRGEGTGPARIQPELGLSSSRTRPRSGGGPAWPDPVWPGR